MPATSYATSDHTAETVSQITASQFTTSTARDYHSLQIRLGPHPRLLDPGTCTDVFSVEQFKAQSLQLLQQLSGEVLQPSTSEQVARSQCEQDCLGLDELWREAEVVGLVDQPGQPSAQAAIDTGRRELSTEAPAQQAQVQHQPRQGSPPEAGAGAGWQPEALVGRQLKVLRPEDNAWRQCAVLQYNKRTKHHHLRYDDGQQQRLDLAAHQYQLLPALQGEADKAGTQAKRSTADAEADTSKQQAGRAPNAADAEAGLTSAQAGSTKRQVDGSPGTRAADLDTTTPGPTTSRPGNGCEAAPAAAATSTAAGRQDSAEGQDTSGGGQGDLTAQAAGARTLVPCSSVADLGASAQQNRGQKRKIGLKDMGVRFMPEAALQAAEHLRDARRTRLTAAAQVLRGVREAVERGEGTGFKRRSVDECAAFQLAVQQQPSSAAADEQGAPEQQADRQTSGGSGADGEVGREEVVLTVSLHHPGRAERLQQWRVLGRQRLTHLKDRLYCRSDADMNNLGLAIPSGFFYIEGTFYNDMRGVDAVDYSSPIRQFCEAHHLPAPRLPAGMMGAGQGSGAQGYRTANMEDVRFEDLVLRVGEGANYIYCHQGCCEHLLVFDDVRLIGTGDPQALGSYPLLTWNRFRRQRRCTVCDTHLAAKVTYGDPLAPDNPCFWCKPCFELMHYDNENKLLYSDFQVFAYDHE